MEMEEIEALLEKIWDIHDKLSDAIHAISRSHFLNSIKTLKKSEKKKPCADADDERGTGTGFVFVKECRIGDDEAIAEAKSLNAIRTALEHFEDQLEFFHTVQSQQRAEIDAAVARLEQSRIFLAMRLADHHGKKYKVIEEALEFVGDVHDAVRFVSPEALFQSPSKKPGEGKRSNILLRFLLSSVTFAKKFLRADQMGGVLGNAALLAISMLAILHLQQVTFKNNLVDAHHIQEHSIYGKRNGKNASWMDGSSTNGRTMHLDVLAARG
ncbi:hypothetical protein Scep_025805 [Stephania cephalantha]|uniref:Plastid division protein PDV1 n=1 Tax=Stephania cephalantha TaxID=152367 RepID=A0AAP0HRX1_9MAGN